QWFGNCLTPLTWKDVWLSESFATYSEAVYAQGKYGYEAFCSYVQSSYHDYYLSFANSNGDRVIYDPEYLEYFYPMVYEKGASVLHMLRAWVGNETFFNILRTYFQTYHNQNVVTAEFKQIAETVSGLDLDQFFDQWIFKKGIPQLDYVILKSADQINFKTISKSTTTEPGNQFFMKIPFRYETAAGMDSVLVDANPQGAVSVFTTNSPVLSYAFDPKNWILCRGKFQTLPVLNNCFATSGRVIVNWNPMPEWTNINTYHVYRSLNPNNSFVKINAQPVQGNSFTDNNVTNGQTYYYKVTACTDIYETDYSNSLSAQPIDFPMDQGILVIDESNNGNGNLLNPSDEQVDDFYSQVIGSAYTSWDVSTQGLPDVNLFRNYSLIIWHDDDTVTSQINEEVQQSFVSYIMAGGKVILSGWKTANSINNSYLNEILQSTEKVSINTPSFSSAISDELPVLTPDPDKLNQNWNGLLPSVCVFPNATQVLYRAQFNNNSAYQNAPVVISGENFVLSGLPFYYIQQEAITNMFSMILNDWSVSSDECPVSIYPKMNMHIYPNPTGINQSMSVAIKNVKQNQIKMNVYNVKGQLVKSECLNNDRSNGAVWTWNKKDDQNHDLASGVYFIKAQTDHQQIVKKFIIIK
ncbi:MAG TPA: M1 family aminopeptidase, partial [Candidatus Cloacimonadota bacterium]|nr:M1 family aminopeptidase [Candidatus Cloacimonadota bacterium]